MAQRKVGESGFSWGCQVRLRCLRTPGQGLLPLWPTPAPPAWSPRDRSVGSCHSSTLHMGSSARQLRASALRTWSLRWPLRAGLTHHGSERVHPRRKWPPATLQPPSSQTPGTAHTPWDHLLVCFSNSVPGVWARREQALSVLPAPPLLAQSGAWHKISHSAHRRWDESVHAQGSCAGG